MGATILLEDDATPATGLVFTAAAGDTSAAQVFHVWYNKGTPGGTAQNVRIRAEVEDPPGTWIADGALALSEHWVEARINGGDNEAAVAGFVASATDWFRLGAGTFLPVPDIPGNCARYLEVRLHPPLKDGVATETVSFRLVVRHGDNVDGISSGVTDALSGVLTGIGDRSVREFVEAPAVTASGSPDDQVHVSRAWYVYDGIPYRRTVATDLTLNQNDSAAEALTSGQAYIAIVSQPPGDGSTEVAAVATKGVRAASASAIAPDLPAGNLLVARVVVGYQAGGTSVIATANITSLCYGSRYSASGVGLAAVTFQPGRALLKGAMLRDTLPQAFTPANSSTRYYWLTTSGTIVETTTATPATAGDMPLAKVVKTATISSITDLRTFLEPNAQPIRLAIAGNESTGTAVARARVDRPFVLDRITFGVRTASTGATGSTTIDLNVAGATIFGTAPAIAAQGTEDDASYPLKTVFDAGWLTLDVDAITSGGTRAVDLEAIAWTYPGARAA